MKRKTLAALLLTPIMALTLATAAGCSLFDDDPYVTSVEQKAGEDGNVIVFHYSDGSKESVFLPYTGGSADVSAEDLYLTFLDKTGKTSEEYSYAQFLEDYLDLTVTAEATQTVAKNLQSVVKIYSEWVVSSGSGAWSSSNTSVSAGSGVIYKMNESDGYTYMITNYHVVNNSSADTNKNGGSTIARKIYCYLYGSESFVAATSSKDENGYTKYNYGEYAIACEFVGGSASSDIALIRAKTSDMKAINPSYSEIKFAEGYSVGETAIAIGNPNSEGISVTRGVVSVDSEYITLSGVDGTARSYRVMRIDTSIYAGSSGGGLFNLEGELIGITNAGSSSDADQNVNYALPVSGVKAIVENLYEYCAGTSETRAYKIMLGVTDKTENSRYVYDAGTGTGRIVEDVVLDIVNIGSIAEKLGLFTGDRILSVTVNGTVYKIEREHEMRELLLTVRAGDALSLSYQRNGETKESAAYTVKTSDLVAVE
ncbi:MAG: S1C family serine protease [Candidatus Gallimonas sp.]